MSSTIPRCNCGWALPANVDLDFQVDPARERKEDILVSYDCPSCGSPFYVEFVPKDEIQ